VLLIVGAILALPMVPGPGIVVMLLGLGLLSHEFEWARRLRDWVHREFHRVTRRDHVG
jgi:putative transmembrane protein PGPGW